MLSHTTVCGGYAVRSNASGEGVGRGRPRVLQQPRVRPRVRPLQVCKACLAATRMSHRLLPPLPAPPPAIANCKPQTTIRFDPLCFRSVGRGALNTIESERVGAGTGSVPLGGVHRVPERPQYPEYPEYPSALSTLSTRVPRVPSYPEYPEYRDSSTTGPWGRLSSWHGSAHLIAVLRRASATAALAPR